MFEVKAKLNYNKHDLSGASYRQEIRFPYNSLVCFTALGESPSEFLF